ncbi:hypothetical protein QQX98_011255 [Neonectria punicea]|uniref:Serine/threonine-protein kinase ppk6 n=1 Tax=Neonectria punicea TaxID=979145 RepID=A0ABR1GMK7_9HYPO
MSADLFAEFNDLSDNPPRPPPATQPPARAALQKDPFDFFNTAGHASTATSQTAPPAQSWFAFQSQPVSTSSWGNVSASVAPTATSKPQVVAEDDDGWGDFEVAQPTAAASAPARPPAVAAAANTSWSIAWHNPSQPVAPAPSKPSSIAWNSPAQTAPPVPSISPSIAWQSSPVPAPAPSISPSIAWHSPTQSAFPAASITSSIAYQSPVQPTVPAPAISPSTAWQTPTQSMIPPPSGSPSVAWQSPAPAPSTPQVTTAQNPPVRSRVVRASTLDLMSNSLVDTSGVPQHAANSSWGQPEPHVNQQFEQQPAHEIKSQSRIKPKLKAGPVDLNVLFDAEDFELQVPEGDEDEDDDDDEFGDFETVSPAPPPPPKPAPPKPAPMMTSPPPPSMDLLSLDDPAPPPPQPTKVKSPPSQLLRTLAFGSTAVNYPQAPKSPSFQDRNPFPELAIKTPTGPAPKDEGPKSTSPITAWPSLESTVKIKAEEDKDEDEGWGAWDDFPANDSRKTDVDSTKPPESWDWDAVDNVKPSKSSKPSNLEINDNTPPPTNVPPPSVILSVFPELLNAGDALFKPMSGQNASIKQRIISEPKAVDFIEAYILLAMTAARVIAGRKQRWHRDKILAKSMSISAAGSKGMKLAGVDKTQSVREDREAADIVAVWRGQVGRLRSAVAAAKGTGNAPTLRVPEISETMHVQTAKSVPTAPKACIICGLKREERVTKVDNEVEDSFGEWWADHWGHKACKNFWIQHEQMLRQR